MKTILILIMVAMLSACSNTPEVSYKQVTVHSGDTVWKLIRKNNDNDVDIGYLSYKYEEHGGSNIIHIGEVVEIPVVKGKYEND